MQKVVLGLSGGVDSAVCAELLKREGYEVHALYLDISTEAALQDACMAAEFLRIPLSVVNIAQELEEYVCKPFAHAYLHGETPNPCILCNPSVKFKALLSYADTIGAPYVATGHYARTMDGALYKGMPANDQSYMLCRLKRAQISRLILPLGGYEKREVRALAEELGIPVANKPDSMEICFIPDKDYISWLHARGISPAPGDVLFHGDVIARHEGIHRYTVGQRWPGLYRERKLYVSKLNAQTNEIELALWEELFKTEIYVHDMNWMIDAPHAPLRASVRVRHTKWENPDCTLTPLKGACAQILCDAPVRAPARGQSAALYCGEQVIGGGFIE